MDWTFEGGLLPIVARGAADLGTLLLFGVTLFNAYIAPKALARAPAEGIAASSRRLRRLALVAAVVSAAGSLIWFVVQSASMADASAPAAVIHALGLVATGTQFGQISLLQLGLIVLAGVAIWRRRAWAAAVLAGLATVVYAGHSHAASMFGLFSLPVVVATIHLLAAGAWVGGVVPLLLMTLRDPPRMAACAARWFSPPGKVYVLAVAVTAAIQGWELIGGVPGLIGTSYGWMGLIKITLFTVLTGYALVNRYQFAPALLGAAPVVARRHLLRSLAVQTGFGVAVIAAAAVLSSLSPSIHDQPAWPFASRPSLAAMADPDFRREVARACLAVACAVAIGVAAIVWRRVRWPGLIAAAGIAALAAPHFDLLLVEAYPTSYYHSPTGFAAASIVHGWSVYGANCVACHGVNGQGDGPLAKAMADPPADLTAAHLWEHSDGELFWWISDGMFSPEGERVMPGFGDRLSTGDRWDLIDAIRAHNAGVSMHDTGQWTNPVQAPGFTASCAGDASVDLSALRGHVVRLIMDGGGEAPLPAAAGSPAVTDIYVAADARPTATACAATDPDLPAALSLLTGQTAAELAGEQFLIDPDGWLRARGRLGQPGDWSDTQSLLAAVSLICTHPLNAEGGSHAHHHEAQ